MSTQAQTVLKFLQQMNKQAHDKSSKGKPKRKRNRKRKGKSSDLMSSSSTNNNFKQVSAPSTIGTLQQSNFMRFCGLAQRNADYEYEGSLRLSGRELLLSVQVTTANGGGYWPISNNATQFSPASFVRLAQIARNYTYYAFRKLRLYYIPNCSTSTQGSFAFAMLKNANQVQLDSNYLSANITDIVVLNNATSMETPVWTPSVLEANHSGDKVWSIIRQANTTTTFLQNDYDEYQFGFVGVVNNGVTNGTYGRLVAEYVIDLYEMTDVQPTTPSTLPILSTSTSKSENDSKSSVSLKTKEEEELKDLPKLKLERQNGYTIVYNYTGQLSSSSATSSSSSTSR